MPAEKYYGAQTARSLIHFDIGGPAERMPVSLVSSSLRHLPLPPHTRLCCSYTASCYLGFWLLEAGMRGGQRGVLRVGQKGRGGHSKGRHRGTHTTQTRTQHKHAHVHNINHTLAQTTHTIHTGKCGLIVCHV